MRAGVVRWIAPHLDTGKLSVCLAASARMDDDAAHELVTNGQQAVDELSRTVSQCTDSISSAASELTHARSGKEVASAASELKQAAHPSPHPIP